MADSDFQNFLIRRRAAAEAYVNGDPAPLDKIVPTTGGASFHSPSGETFSGAAIVAERYRKDGASFARGSETHFEILQQESDGKLAFWTGFQIATVCMVDKAEPVEMRIRITEVFHHIDGEWKMIHRHADAVHREK